MVPRIIRTSTIALVVLSSVTTLCSGQDGSLFRPTTTNENIAPMGILSAEIDFQQISSRNPPHADMEPATNASGLSVGNLGTPGNRLFSEVTNFQPPSWIQPPNPDSGNQAVLEEPQAEINQGYPGSDLVNGLFYASFDAMYLSRSGPSPQALVFTDGVPTLTTASFSYGAEFSPAVTIGIGDQWGYAFEFNYFKSSNHEFNGVQQGTNVVPVFFGGVPAASASAYAISAEAQLDNYELTQWVRYTDRLRLGLGLRVLDLHEEYSIRATDNSASFFADASNQLFGGQFAAQYTFFSNDFAALYFQGKTGMYYNRVKITGASQSTQISPDSDEFSVVGDLRLVADLPLTDIFSFRFGYHATFLSRIAQAIDQNDDLSLASPDNPGLIDFSTPTYRGGFFGFVGNY